MKGFTIGFIFAVMMWMLVIPFVHVLVTYPW